MEISSFISILKNLGADFYTGVPDSLLAPFCDYIYGKYSNHVVAANEGAAVGLAAGHYLGTGKPAVVYMQNSGLGNAVNPICSLTKLYDIPVIFVIGWRGEPGVPDEPQHGFQGEITLSLLDCLRIPYIIVGGHNKADFNTLINQGKSVAFVIKKDALKYNKKQSYPSYDTDLSRETTLRIIFENTNTDDVFVCTTGKLSREVFELRKQMEHNHDRDFLTVGSMGHSLMIAYGIALSNQDKKVYCLDGDGAAVMHLGSLSVAGCGNLKNLIHIVINNGAHETVGGMPLVSSKLNLAAAADSLGYSKVYRAASEYELIDALSATVNGSLFIEVICNTFSRRSLGRPTGTPIENKNAFMKNFV